jgi:hypothetical protein
MERMDRDQANSFFASARFFSDMKNNCNSKCVVDFQHKNIGAMEMECAHACIQKFMTLYDDLKAIGEKN